jgi:YD repeat-containing protein
MRGLIWLLFLLPSWGAAFAENPLMKAKVVAVKEYKQGRIAYWEGTVAVTAGTGQSPVTGTTYAPAGTITAPAGYLTGVTYGSADTDAFTPDVNTGRMNQYKYTVNGQSVIGNLTWNTNGSLKQLAVTNPVYTASSMTCTYAHDDLSRIASVDCPGKWQQTFTYDAFGNIRKVPGSSIAFDATYNVATNRVTNLGITYDTNGNVTNDGAHTYGWDAENRASNFDAHNPDVIYDAFGRMVEQVEGSTFTRWVYGLDGQKLAIVTATNLINGFVGLPGGALRSTPTPGSATIAILIGWAVRSLHPQHRERCSTVAPSRRLARHMMRAARLTARLPGRIRTP